MNGPVNKNQVHLVSVVSVRAGEIEFIWSVLSVYEQVLSVLSVHEQVLSVLSVYEQVLSVLSVYEQVLSVLSVYEQVLSVYEQVKTIQVKIRAHQQDHFHLRLVKRYFSLFWRV